MEQPYFRQQSARDALRQGGNRERRHFPYFWAQSYVAPDSPTVALVGGGTQFAAPVNLSKSDAYSLTFTAPAGLVAGRTCQVLVSNGFGSAYADICILGHAINGSDYFNLDVAWGRDFLVQNGPSYTGIVDNKDHHVFNVPSDPFVTPHAKGDGVNDDRPAIQAAINLAAKHGGGVVYLPAGTYKLAYVPYSWGLTMASGVVIQGHAAAGTKILLGSAQATSSNFSGFGWRH